MVRKLNLKCTYKAVLSSVLFVISVSTLYAESHKLVVQAEMHPPLEAKRAKGGNEIMPMDSVKAAVNGKVDYPYGTEYENPHTARPPKTKQ